MPHARCGAKPALVNTISGLVFCPDVDRHHPAYALMVIGGDNDQSRAQIKKIFALLSQSDTLNALLLRAAKQ
jgi:hypothetical protein